MRRVFFAAGFLLAVALGAGGIAACNNTPSSPVTAATQPASAPATPVPSMLATLPASATARARELLLRPSRRPSPRARLRHEPSTSNLRPEADLCPTRIASPKGAHARRGRTAAADDCKADVQEIGHDEDDQPRPGWEPATPTPTTHLINPTGRERRRGLRKWPSAAAWAARAVRDEVSELVRKHLRDKSARNATRRREMHPPVRRATAPIVRDPW